MRHFILIALFFSCLTTIAAVYPTPTYLLKSAGKIEAVTLSDNGDIATNKLMVGETYVRENSQSDYNTHTNASLSLLLANETIVSLDENTEFKLHSSTVDIVNRGSLPSSSSFTNKNHVASLMGGSVDIINTSSNGTFLLQTPRVSMTVGKGKFRVIVQGKTTIVVALEGTVTLHKLVESKSGVISDGKFAHVTTYYSLVTKGVDVLNNGKATATVKPIDEEDSKKMTESFSDLLRLGSSVMFVEIDNKTVGVKIR